MKFICLFALFFLLLSCHYDSNSLCYGVGGSYQSQSQSRRFSEPEPASATAMKPEYSLAHGPDATVNYNWRFQERWFQPSFIIARNSLVVAWCADHFQLHHNMYIHHDVCGAIYRCQQDSTGTISIIPR